MHRFDIAAARAALRPLGLALLVTSSFSPCSATTPGHTALARTALSFQPVPGENSPAVRFRARGLNYRFEIAPAHADIVLSRLTPVQPAGLLERGRFTSGHESVLGSVRLSLIGANPQGLLSGQGELAGKVHSFLGDIPDRWQANATLYSRVRVGQVYPGIDLVYYGNQEQLEYDFVVAPNADPDLIKLKFAGADSVELAPSGELIICMGKDSIQQHRPVMYQELDGRRVIVDGSYEVHSDRTIGFRIAEYNRELPLVIDPILSYSSFFGGTSGDIALSVKLDAGGFIYIAGQTLSAEFPFSLPSGGIQGSFGGGTINGDAFVAKFDSTGKNLVYFTYLGGSGNDGALDLAVEPDGHAYISGFTDSRNFATTTGAFDRVLGGTPTSSGLYYSDAFVAKLSPSGSTLVYSTYFGGSLAEAADGIAIDAAGSAYITGYTRSTNDFPTVRPLQGRTRISGSSDAFVAKLNSTGTGLIYSTYLGGSNSEEGQGIAVDPQGLAYVTGYTSSTNFPTTNAFRTLLNGTNLPPSKQAVYPYDAFLTRVSPSGDSLVYSTFLGGAESDAGFRVAVDSEGNAFLAGGTDSVDFPNTLTNVPGLSVGFTNQPSASYDAFVTRVNADGSLGWSSRFGGFRDDVGWDLALDAGGRVFVAGTSASTNFPVLNNAGFRVGTNSLSFANHAFVTCLSGLGSELLYSLVFGGSAEEMAYGIAADPAGNAYVVGRTLSPDFPTTGSPVSPQLSGNNDAFLAKIGLEPSLAASLSTEHLELRWRAFSPDYSLETTTGSTTADNWSPVTAKAVLTNGWHSITLDATNQGSFFRLRK